MYDLFAKQRHSTEIIKQYDTNRKEAALTFVTIMKKYVISKIKK